MLIAGTVLVSVLLTLFLSLVNTRRIPLEELKSNAEIADKYLMILTAVYGIFLAFIITNLWATNDKAIDIVNSEASELVYSGMLTSGLDPKEQQQILERLRAYAGSVIHQEWPLMERAHGAKEILTYGPFELLWQSIIDLPTSNAETYDIRDRLLDAIHEIGDKRRTRLLLSGDRLTLFLKIAIVVGAVATIIPITYLRASRWRFQIVGSLCAVGLLTMMVCLVFDLSSEYSGLSPISVEPFQTAYGKLGYLAIDPRLQRMEAHPKVPCANERNRK